MFPALELHDVTSAANPLPVLADERTTIEPFPTQALYEATAMTQPQPAYDPDIQTAAGKRDVLATLVETQMKLATGLTIHSLIAGVAIALGVPLIVLNLVPINEWMPWVVVCSAAVTGTGIIVTTLAIVIVSYLRTSRCLMKLLERDHAS